MTAPSLDIDIDPVWGDATDWEALAAAAPSGRWGVDWIYKEDTAFAAWIQDGGGTLVPGAALFDAQAAAQSTAFIRECGG